MPVPFAAALSSKLLRFASASFFEAGFLIRDLREFFAYWGPSRSWPDNFAGEKAARLSETVSDNCNANHAFVFRIPVAESFDTPSESSAENSENASFGLRLAARCDQPASSYDKFSGAIREYPFMEYRDLEDSGAIFLRIDTYSGQRLIFGCAVVCPSL
jgi:hypothetical protein